MKSFMKKLFGAEINIRLVSIGAVVLLIALAVPIARIMMYCVPWYDDFGYGQLTKNFWLLNHSYVEALQGALLNVKGMWYAWQGTYTSCFFMSLMPAVWGTDKYVIGLWAILLVLILSVFALVKVLMKDVLKCQDRWSILFVQAMVALTVMSFMRSAIEGFFWYNSAVHYTGMHSLGILLVAGCIKLICVKGRVKTVLLTIGSVIGAIMVAGVNNVTALQVGLVILSIIALCIILKNKRGLLLLPATVFYAVGLYFNMASPGNAKRMVHFEGMMLSPVEAILRSFQSAFTYFDDFTGLMTLAIVIFMIPIILKIVSKVNFEFKYPGLVLLWSFCLYATGFTPTLYTMGHTLLGRATNMAKVTFQILLFINLAYFIGWLYRVWKEKKGVTLNWKSTWCHYIIVVMLMVAIFAVEPNKGGKYAPYCAYYFIHTGEAYNYHQEYLQRVEICEGEGADVVVSPYVFKPWVLCLGDLSEDPNYEPNKFMAQFFYKNSITCVAPDSTAQE